VLHSPFSPLSPGSTLYPDGIIDARWIEKHQELIPSICLCFYSITSDPTLATLHDNQLKTDINALKNALSRSGYKCRLVTVILSDQAPNTMSAFQDRLENIRWGTGLDPKTSLFVLPTQRSESELETAVDSILNSVFVQATEYYRELGRRSRKKRGRGIAPQPTIPPTSGTSHTLSLQGWNVRYDFKTGVFAEFRQEMDVALRSYEQAYETLLGSDVLESVPSWTPRFSDGRLISDMLAVRILRCLLWSGQSTAAVRRWQSHRVRLSDFLDRKGQGTQNYGWQAWEARWAEVMANLVERTAFPELDPSAQTLFRPPEKVLAAERLQPWEQLHHPGYWYRIAARHALDRRKLAHALPRDVRTEPDEADRRSTATALFSYDTYMCPQPYREYPLEGQGTNHAQLILKYLNLARAEFQKRQQTRLAAEVAIEASAELEQIKAWKPLCELLTPLWRDVSFRKEGWLEVTQTLSWTLRHAAAETGHADLVVAIDWELLSNSTCCNVVLLSRMHLANEQTDFYKRPGWNYNITKSLEGVQVNQRPEIAISDDHVISFLTSTFVFKHEEGRAGQTCPAQLALTSNALPGSAPVVLDEVRVSFEGSVRPIRLKHEASTPSTKRVVVTPVTLADTECLDEVASDEGSESGAQPASSIILDGAGDLTLMPGQTRVFEVNVPLRAAGEAHASAVSVTLAPEAFKLTYNMKIREHTRAGLWYTTAGRSRATKVNAQNIKVLPRPPKMEIRFVNVLKQYYAGEPIRIEMELVNDEDVDANTKLDVHLYGQDVPSFKAQDADGNEQSSTGHGEEAKLNGLVVGTIETSKSAKAAMTVSPISRPTAYDLTVKAVYTLVSDSATPIVQAVSFQINIVNPFEASYELVPRLHSESWPSVFDQENIQDISDVGHDAVPQAMGLAQKWCLVTRFGSFATENIRVVDLETKVRSTEGAVRCTVTRNGQLPPSGLTMAPRTMEQAQFDIVAQKLSLDDRSPSIADLAFAIKWQRITEDGPSSTTLNSTVFHLDPFYVTVSEPRVLAAVSYTHTTAPGARKSIGSAQPDTQPASSPLIILDVTIENPSNHFLTFGLTMEPSDQFAFSGAKTTTINVLPIARCTVTYRLLPLVAGGSWIRPQLVVRDKYFQKVLKIIPTEGMKRDGDGVGIWVPEDAAEAAGEGNEKSGEEKPSEE
jgi:trafficking protein particle complex subunit 11